MNLFNHIQITNIDEDINPLDLSEYHRERLSGEDEAQDEHPGQYFCGVCGWVDQKSFPCSHQSSRLIG